jgi:hypothetical protein
VALCEDQAPFGKWKPLKTSFLGNPFSEHPVQPSRAAAGRRQWRHMPMCFLWKQRLVIAWVVAASLQGLSIISTAHVVPDDGDLPVVFTEPPTVWPDRLQLLLLPATCGFSSFGLLLICFRCCFSGLPLIRTFHAVSFCCRGVFPSPL